jgi:ATP-dependent DNA helicase RecQ
MAAPAPADYQSPRSNRRTVEAARPKLSVVAEADGPVVEALKAWRKKRASADGVPAYIVLSDAHLNGIAAKMPSSLDELARCAGIGPTKLERYGDEIVAAIANVR